jgi:HD-like signal output (HDOD) protein/ActR/RegA family two-component response regulator
MQGKKSVLFVDDEPNILDGIRRMMRSARHEWDMSFAGSGEEALQVMEQTHFDVIVTDMRMPGMDGAALLQEVKKRFPEVARIVLSGQADKEAIYRALGPMHRYLAKPCDAETLKATLQDACAVGVLVGDGQLKQLVSKMGSLPSVPDLYDEMMKELESPDASIKKVGDIISKDISMTAKILQIVNSALFSLQRQVTDPAQAVSLLGLDTIKSLVLTVHVFSQFDQTQMRDLSINALWSHSVTVGSLSKKIAKAESDADPKLPDNAFMAGLLHDIGKLVLAVNLPQDYAAAMALKRSEGLSGFEAEKQTFGACHAKVGGYLIGLWGLPSPVVEALAFHHNPIDAPTKNLSTLTAVHVANALEKASRNAHGADDATGMDEAYLAELGVADRLEGWKDLLRELVGASEAESS